MVNIVQISDLHYVSGFRQDCFENIVDYLQKKRPDALVMTGDLVDKGRYKQYIRFKENVYSRLKELNIPMVQVIGNHDAKRNGIIFFERFFGSRWSKLTLEEKETVILGLCSARDDVSEGEIGDIQLEHVARQFNRVIENRVLALHHHVIGVPYSGRKRTTLMDAGELIELCHLFQVDLVLQGHKHIPHAHILGSTTFLYCGTSTTDKVRADEAPSFNYIELDKGDLRVQIVNSETLEEDLLVERKDDMTVFVRPRKTRIEHLLNNKIFGQY